MSRLIEALRAQRQSWVDVDEGKRVQIIRPAESEIGEFLHGSGKGRTMGAELPQVIKFVTGWEGITEADLLGESVGASDPVPFDSELWGEVVKDRAEWLKKVGSALIETIVKHFEKKAEAEKN